MEHISLNEQFMRIASEAAQRSNCSRRKVGAVIVRDGVAIVQACNGTPIGMIRCDEGGCSRCLSQTPHGQEYESCLCIHAEQAAIASASRVGIPIGGGTMYCTLRPCLTCVKLCVEAGVTQIVYDGDTRFSPDIEEAYGQLLKQLGNTFVRHSEEAKR